MRYLQAKSGAKSPSAPVEVVRTGRFTGGRRASNPVRRLGKATWIVGVREAAKDPTEQEQKRIDRRTRELEEPLGTNEDNLGLIKWGKKSRFGRECRAGDTLIEIWNSRDRNRSIVTRPVRVLLKDPEPVFNRFYTEQASHERVERGQLVEVSAHPEGSRISA
jgi:hypothetical protein